MYILQFLFSAHEEKCHCSRAGMGAYDGTDVEGPDSTSPEVLESGLYKGSELLGLFQSFRMGNLAVAII